MNRTLSRRLCRLEAFNVPLRRCVFTFDPRDPQGEEKAHRAALVTVKRGTAILIPEMMSLEEWEALGDIQD